MALAKQGHRFKACVARELADAGYCSTKKTYYYGVRVHIVGRRQAGTLPVPSNQICSVSISSKVACRMQALMPILGLVIFLLTGVLCDKIFMPRFKFVESYFTVLV